MRKALVVAQLVVVLLIARNWAYVTTYRLYLDDRLGGGAGSDAVQRFDVEGAGVVPQIVTRGPDRLVGLLEGCKSFVGQDAVPFFVQVQDKMRALEPLQRLDHVQRQLTEKLPALGPLVFRIDSQNVLVLVTSRTHHS